MIARANARSETLSSWGSSLSISAKRNINETPGHSLEDWAISTIWWHPRDSPATWLGAPESRRCPTPDHWRRLSGLVATDAAGHSERVSPAVCLQPESMLRSVRRLT